MVDTTMSGKVILLTGGNSGIGLAAAGQLAQKGAQVIITVRDEEKASQAKQAIANQYDATVDTLLLDLADFNSIRACVKEFKQKYDRLDVLINNAGLNLSERRETPQGFEYVLGVNHVGPFLLTSLLLDYLKANAPSRVVCLSSAGHMGARKGMTWDDLQRQKKYGTAPYCEVKLGTIYWAKEMAKRYKEFGITAYSVNPRLVTTNFAMDGDTSGIQKLFFTIGKFWMLKPDEGAKTTVWCASEPGIEDLSGQYFQDCAPRKPSSFAENEESAKRFWELSEEWIANEHP
ncbi:SDR family NAD(P)-dependent oxidoreductase [Oceanicoccus sp. KOV_DT_Chl]|uniref:SDR family NAD(P)-dependent oxidoreductase n=1 Tax=Oceanicoccus sp. KOV_DT_Chl TaxID=1904639 RepID=UPI000C799225|nr:SDR family NAD(P)-dependent oxidoreductase [Oceanicoccus sp. KOV_DT_Chl]